MTKQIINVGSAEQAGDGESVRSAFIKINENFTEVYDQQGASDRLVNGEAQLTIAQDGTITIPNGAAMLFGNGNSRIQAGMGFHIYSEEGISLEAANVADPFNPIYNNWYFSPDGGFISSGYVILSTIAKSGIVEGSTAIDLGKSVNKLADGEYTLADGVDGQILYLASDPSVTNAPLIKVVVDNWRTNSGPSTGGWLYPFNSSGTCSLLFTDGSWQVISGGVWD